MMDQDTKLGCPMASCRTRVGDRLTAIVDHVGDKQVGGMSAEQTDNFHSGADGAASLLLSSAGYEVGFLDICIPHTLS